MSKKKTTTDVNVTSQDELIGLIERTHGAGSVMVGRGTIVNVKTFPTNVPSIDVALGCGGIPNGRIVEIFGPESSGKTTTCLQFIASCQNHYFEEKQRNGVAAFIDAEHALDPEWASKIGVDLDKLILSQPNYGEEAFSIAEIMIKSKLVDLIVIDSVAALIPKVELHGDINDANVGAHARLMSKGLRKIVGALSSSKCTIIFINQIREKIGVMFGSPETTPGGRALKFYASIRGDVRRSATLKEGDNVVGFRTTMKIVKNKVGPPFQKAEFDICVGRDERPVYGIDTIASLIDVATSCGVIKKNGASWFVYDEQRLGNGMTNAANYLRADEKLVDEIRSKTYDKAFAFSRIIDDSEGIAEKFTGEVDELDADLDNDILDDD